jgi:hypothetical protein
VFELEVHHGSVTLPFEEMPKSKLTTVWKEMWKGCAKKQMRKVDKTVGYGAAVGQR